MFNNYYNQLKTDNVPPIACKVAQNALKDPAAMAVGVALSESLVSVLTSQTLEKLQVNKKL